MKTAFLTVFLFSLSIQLSISADCPLSSKNKSERYGIKFGEPFDPDKLPVLFIHGLFSDSDTWSRMDKALRNDPGFVENYQCWFYGYESGTPTIGAAALLKVELDETIRNIEKIHGISMHRRLTVVGHSLGGIIAKSLISDTGDQLWNAAFTAPIDQFDLSDKDKALLSTAFFYQPRTYVGKTIFLATPHRGSALASGLTGKIATSIASRSAKVEALIEAVRTGNRQFIQPGSECLYENNISSIQSLRQDSPIRQLMFNLPIDPQAEYHSISGIKNRKFRGDGVVPIQNTILPGAYCEIGIFSRHKVHHKEETFDLVNLMIKTDFDQLSDDVAIERLLNAPFAFVRFKGRLLR